VIFEPFTVVRVPFPFTDQDAIKRRPALVLSSADFNAKSGHSLMAMITSSTQTPWPLDHHLHAVQSAGLRGRCLVRMKLFTLDNRLILGKLGQLGSEDEIAVRSAIRRMFGLG
jgi:mRNA interferase MazF